MAKDDPVSLDRKIFRLISNSATGDAKPGETVFHFRQHGQHTFWGSYRGGKVASGTLVGHYLAPHKISLHFQQITTTGEYRSGCAEADIEVPGGGLLRLSERWQFDGGAAGEAVLEEVPVTLDDAT